MRRGRAGWIAALGAAAALALPERAAADDVRVRRVDGEDIFTMRPTRRPEPSVESVPPAAVQRVAPSEIEALVAEVSSRYGLDPRLVTTVIGVESGFNPRAVSPKGARGLMQLMPPTAKQYGVRDPHDPRENVEGGVAYLKDLVQRYGGDLRMALAAYNAGPEAVERSSGIPNYPETRDYLRRIEERYGVLALGGAAGDGGTRAWRTSAPSIRATRDQDGNLVVTNSQGPGLRVVRRGRR